MSTIAPNHPLSELNENLRGSALDLYHNEDVSKAIRSAYKNAIEKKVNEFLL